MDIKYFSQMDNQIPEDFRRKACGPVCAKMVIDYNYPESNKDINELIEEGKLIGAFDLEREVWLHDGLVRLMRNYGISCYPQEFRSVKVNLITKSFEQSEYEEELMQRGIEKIMRFAKRRKPVIASFKVGFTDNTQDHLVLIKGVKSEKEGNSPLFIIHDPSTGPDIEISLDHFLKYWKKFAIFVN